MSRRSEKTSSTPVGGAKLKLLTGGNPQIPKGDGDGPVQDYIAAMPDWKHAAGQLMDQLIVQTIPAVRKAVRWNTPFFGLENNGWFVAFGCTTEYVKVTFFRGTSLKPVPPIASKQAEVRYFHFCEADEIDEVLFTSWVQQAAKLPGEKLF